MKWNVIYWTSSSGRSPVRKYIDRLPEAERTKMRNLYRLIQEFGPQLGVPHMKRISNYKPLLEFRITGKRAIRLLAFSDKPYVIILHAFSKKSMKIPQKELQTAYKRYQQIT